MIEHDMVNTPVAFTLAGREILLKRIGSARKRSIFQSNMLKDLVAEIKAKSQAFDSVSDKLAFVNAEIIKLPAGTELQNMVDNQKVRYAWIVEVLSVMSGMSFDELDRLLDEGSDEDVAAIMGFITYGKKKLSSPPQSGESFADAVPKMESA